MKRINHFKTSHDKVLHIDSEGCVINITVGLHDIYGNPVTSIQVSPDKEEGWLLDGYSNTRVYKGGTSAGI